jgi:hypothetical protein
MLTRLAKRVWCRVFHRRRWRRYELTGDGPHNALTLCPSCEELVPHRRRWQPWLPADE